MTNFIYIFMIITLIGIGIGIRGFNSEDSDTKTTIKNIPRGLKKVLLIGENVHKVDMVILIGTIMYLLFTVGVVGIYLFANYRLKVHLQYILSGAVLGILFVEIFIIVSAAYREKRNETKQVHVRETVYISHKEKEIVCELFSKYVILSNKCKKDIKGTVYIFPATVFTTIDVDGNIFRKTSNGIEYLSNVGAYKSLAEQLTNEGYQVIRFETKIIANRNMTLEELLNKIVDVINEIQSETGEHPIYFIGHSITCNILLLLQKKIKPQGLILLFGGGETGKQRIIARRKMDKWGRSRKVKERDIEGEYEKVEKLLEEGNVVVADKELFNKRAEFWISNMLEIKNPVLCIASETDWNYNGKEIASMVQNPQITFKILTDIDATMRVGFRNHRTANNLTYMGYLNQKGKRKPEEGIDIPWYSEKIGTYIIEYMEANKE